jgi:hypothetical protein
MTLDDLRSAIRRGSADPVAQGLADYFAEWKLEASSNVHDLERSVERYLGNTWINEKAEFDAVYGLWSSFRDASIRRVGGMTVNERLFIFSLIPQWDRAEDDSERNAIRAKLLC